MSEPQSIQKLLEKWELVPATLKCPRCQETRQGEVPQFFLEIAEREGRTDPWWSRVCRACEPAQDEEERQFRERTKPKTDKPADPGEPELALPREELVAPPELELPTEER